jgi:hypothetical protein
MATRIQLRRDTSENWNSLNPTLFQGEVGYETNTGKFKIGNGSSAWTALDYFLDSSDISVYLTASSASTIYATKAELANVDLVSASVAVVAAIVDSAPSNLNTLNELAAAINDDPSFSTTVSTALGSKLDISTASSTYQTIVPNVSNTEIGYLNGVTSAIQTQLDSKLSLDFPDYTTATVSNLRLTSGGDSSTSSTNHAFQSGQSNSFNIRMDTNKIIAVNNGAASNLNLQSDGGQVVVAGNIVNGSSTGLEVNGPLRLESSRNAANNTRGIDSMQAKIAVSSTDNRQELQIYSAGDAYSTGSRGAGIQLYGTDDSQHAGNISFLTGTPDNGDARMIIAGGSGSTGYVSGATTYTRTNTDTRVTIGNSLWDWVDTKQDTGLLNLKDAAARPAIYIESVGSTDGTSYGTIGIETGRNFGIGHWSGSAYTNRFSISSGGTSTFAGDVNPSVTATHDLGTTSLRWKGIYTTNMYTSDLHLNNGIGDYTVIEGEEDLFLVNNKSGKSFKFALIEVDSSQVPAKA